MRSFSKVSLMLAIMASLILTQPSSGQTEKTSYKKLIYRKLVIDIDKTRIAWKKSDEVSEFDDEFLEAFEDSMKGATIEFNKDGSILVVDGNEAERESKWANMEFDDDAKEISMELDGTEATFTLNEDGDFEIRSNGIVMIATIAKPETDKKPAAKSNPSTAPPKKLVRDLSKPKEFIVGKWTANRSRTTNYLADFPGANNVMLDEAKAICSRKMQLEFDPAGKLVIKDKSKSRAATYTFSGTEKIKTGTKVKLEVAMEKNTGTIEMTLIDGDTIAVLPRFARKDDPPIVFTRVVADDPSAIGKLDKEKAAELLIGGWNFDFDATSEYLEDLDRYDEEDIAEFEEMYGDGEAFNIHFDEEGKVQIESFGDIDESTYEIRRVSNRNNKPRISVRMRNEEIDDVETLAIIVLEKNRIAISAFGEPPLIFVKD